MIVPILATKLFIPPVAPSVMPRPRLVERLNQGLDWKSNEPHPKRNAGGPMVYQIRVKGQVGAQWRDWYEGLAITLEDHGETLLTGRITDQAALHGLLWKVRDLSLPLLSVQSIKTEQTDTHSDKHPHHSERERE